MNPIATPLLLFSLLVPVEKPAPKLPVGKETTYFTGPLDSEGYIDYEAALNDLLSKGITPEKNANVLLWKALGPTPETERRMPAAFFKRLGIEEPPPRGDYLIRLSIFAKGHLKLDQGESDAFFEQLSRATRRSWTAKDYPHIAAWLKTNEKPLAVAIEATKRPDYYNPLVCQRNEMGRSTLLSALLPSVQGCRELANALAARAMLRIGEGKFDEAWQDLLACHRLGRLVARGGCFIEGLVGIAIDTIACHVDVAYLERANLTAKQVQDRLKDLQGLAPMPAIADKTDLGERAMYLDILRFARRNGFSAFESEPAKKTEIEELKVLEKIDWEPALRNSNRWYDRLVAAQRLKDRAEREKALAKIEDDLKALKKAAKPVNFAELVQNKDQPDKMIGKAIGDILISLMMPAFRQVQHAHDRIEQTHRNLHIAFALAAYHSDNKRYPATLDELAPKYLAAIPDDLFSGKALIYRPSEKGYLLYSVGVSGKDEEGRSYGDDPPGKNLSVRMPLPELKPKK